jgi:hypothetical protein
MCTREQVPLVVASSCESADTEVVLLQCHLFVRTVSATGDMSQSTSFLSVWQWKLLGMPPLQAVFGDGCACACCCHVELVTLTGRATRE